MYFKIASGFHAVEGGKMITIHDDKNSAIELTPSKALCFTCNCLWIKQTTIYLVK